MRHTGATGKSGAIVEKVFAEVSDNHVPMQDEALRCALK